MITPWSPVSLLVRSRQMSKKLSIFSVAPPMA